MGKTIAAALVVEVIKSLAPALLVFHPFGVPAVAKLTTTKNAVSF